MGRTNYVHVDCDLLAHTEKAVLIMYDGRNVWVPFSQLAPGEHEKIVLSLEDSDGEPVIDATVSMTEWIAQQKNIEPE